MSLENLENLEFVTVAEVAVNLRVSKMTVYRLIEQRELRTVRVGRSFRVPAQSVRDYLAKHAQ
jgi:excisionase family DNA binding protein